MKFVYALGVAAATATVANGLWNSCSISQYDEFWQAGMLGAHADPTSTAAIDGDCMATTKVYGSKVTQLFHSFQNWQLNDWAAPLYLLSESLVANTDLFAACQTTNMAKQAATRFATIPGVIDLGTTLGVAALKFYTVGESDLW